MSGGKRSAKPKPNAAMDLLTSKGWEVTTTFPSGRVMLVHAGEVYQCASLEKAVRLLKDWPELPDWRAVKL